MRKLVVPPILNEQFTLLVHCVGSPAVKVPARILFPVVCVIPREKVKVSLVLSPKYTSPVVLRVTALVTSVVEPKNLM